MQEAFTSRVLYGTLNGRKYIEEPITPPNYGQVGENGRYIRIPRLFEVDDSGNKIVIEKMFP